MPAKPPSAVSAGPPLTHLDDNRAASRWFRKLNFRACPRVIGRIPCHDPHDLGFLEPPMPNHREDTRPQTADFNRAFSDAKTNAANAAGEVSEAAQDLYGQARDSATRATGAAKDAARSTAESFEQALRNLVENQPYTACAIALGIGWLFGRMHRPL
jgi:ElaB/YqjD/DUF883 family membrane-anchored ribosome-binding protein